MDHNPFLKLENLPDRTFAPEPAPFEQIFSSVEKIAKAPEFIPASSQPFNTRNQKSDLPADYLGNPFGSGEPSSGLFQPSVPAFEPSVPEFKKNATPFQQPKGTKTDIRSLFINEHLAESQNDRPATIVKSLACTIGRPQVHSYQINNRQVKIFKADANGNYKNQLCLVWLDSNQCRYGKRCHNAHGQEELTQAAIDTYGQKFKKWRCRKFHSNLHCSFGEACLFRHESRGIQVFQRHCFTPNLYILESLYQAVPDKREFVEKYSSQTYRLKAFSEIESEVQDDEEISNDSSDGPLTITEMEDCSDNDVSCHSIKLNDGDDSKHEKSSSRQDADKSMNTTQDSVNVDQDFQPTQKDDFPWIPMDDEEADSPSESTEEEGIDISEVPLCLDFI